MPISGFGGGFFDEVLGTASSHLSGFLGQLPAASDTPFAPQIDAQVYAPPGIENNPFMMPDFSNFGMESINPFTLPPDIINPATIAGGISPLGPQSASLGDSYQSRGAKQRQAAAQAAQAQASGAPVAYTPGEYKPTRTDTRIAQKIRQSAVQRGLDPDFATWVAEVEGGLDDAAANRRNRQGSHAYGPYQLLIGGGLGDAALKAGIDPRDPNSWERQIDFALDVVAKEGWGQWEAVTARGIDPQTGTPRARIPASSDPQAQQMPMTPQTSASPQNLTPGNVARPPYKTQFGYGARYTRPFNPNLTHHQGVDLVIPGAPANGRGTPVPAYAGGTVIYLDRDPHGGLGVGIRDGQGYDHFYFHLDDTSLTMGAPVTPGQRIGSLGASGINLNDPGEGGPHLHYEVRHQGTKKSVDPTPWMK